ncbi:MAG: hypothetical protein ACTH0E_12195 [Candidatus Microbacterium stercoravium]
MSRVCNVAAPALIAAALVLLTACSGHQSAFVDLDGEREAADELPQREDYAYENVDVDSSRFVGDHEGTSLWLAQDIRGSGVCLIADASGSDWGVACGGATGLELDGVVGTFHVVPDAAAPPEGATQISENVYAQ